ncbi:hypothetical protein [Pseudoscardovia suis]|uniref:Peptidoglycan-binding protein n=1 Tax=Pseudoscardovia suis TaxID=987063 RepID=A0A261ERG1_9BIFI|nr:hypothetical protein [Pseudoscardovia suis]OZG49439.1 peptidoglycan-binding protein [Pseudoscardovia suis]
MLKGSGADDPNLLSRTLRSYYNNPVSLLQRFKAISESVGASDEGTAKDKFFAEIDGLLDDIYVGLLTDGSNGAYGYSGLEPSEEKPRRQHAKLWLNSSTEFVICFMAGATRKIRDPSHYGIKCPSAHEEDQVFLPVPGENLVCVSIAIERVRDDK